MSILVENQLKLLMAQVANLGDRVLELERRQRGEPQQFNAPLTKIDKRTREWKNQNSRQS